MATAARVGSREAATAAGVAPGAIDVSILIVNYNTCDLLRQCLRSIFMEDQGLELEVLVVDNGSTDRSGEMVTREFPEARLIRNSRNLGFSVANNTAMREARGRFLLLLNSDTIVLPGTLRRIVDYLEQNPEVGVAGCRLVRPSGEIDYACRRSFPTPLVSLTRFVRLNRLFPRSRLFARYNLTYLEERGTYEVDSVVGAFMLLRREVVDEVGGLDEDYFMYGEDIDWCFRIKRANWKVAYVGDTDIIHYKGASSRKESFRMNYHFHRAMVLFHTKHLSRSYPAILNAAVYVGILARFGLLAVNHGVRKCLRPLVPRRWPSGRGAYDGTLLVESPVREGSVES